MPTCGTYYTPGTSTATTTWTTWSQWNNICTTSSTGQCWIIWVDQYGTQYTNQLNNALQAQLTAEQVQALQTQQAQAQAEAARQQEAAQEAAQAAAKKALKLLHSHLTPTQKQALKKHGWFLVEGGKSKKTYRVYGNKYAGNIREVSKGKEIASYCVHAEYNIPLGDQLLAQAISLKLDEDHIIGRANKTALAA